MRSPRSIVTGLLAGVLASLLFAGAVSALEAAKRRPTSRSTAPMVNRSSSRKLTAKGPIVLYTFIAAFTGT